ncbi:hypothetical protein IAR50_004928 [Cryptococcus sp. DSM 104548]
MIMDDLLKLVSADNMALYVPKYILWADSELLRSMLIDISPPTAQQESHSSPRLIEFTDPNIENYRILHFLLAVITRKTLDGAMVRDENATGNRGDTLLSTMRFAEKWDCGLATLLMTLNLMDLAGKGRNQVIISSFDIFVIAAQLNLPHIAAKVIEVYRANVHRKLPEFAFPFLTYGS